ncbi:hypothetical protein [Pleomorphovibrio marinus]|uniref:hypothetical protein n=1 Tax=Pleomorphovibrio marinus TaxID=2164132 RepID=UPI000E0A2AF2|nr:hypothetical protein [Pleomorphovibrio marinus]
MHHLNSLSVSAALVLFLAFQGCSKEQKPEANPYQDKITQPRNTPIQTKLSSLEAYREDVKSIDELMDNHLSSDTVFAVNQSGEKTHLMVLLKDENQIHQHLFVWKIGSMDMLTDELNCCFKEGRLLMARHKDQECYFEKGRMQFWLDEKGQPLPIMDTEEWLDQSNRLINLTGDYLRKFEK